MLNILFKIYQGVFSLKIMLLIVISCKKKYEKKCERFLLNIKKKKEVLYISSFRRHSKVWEVGDEIIIKSYAHAESQLIKSKLMYNNLDRYLSVRQTEVKRDITLAGKQDG